MTAEFVSEKKKQLLVYKEHIIREIRSNEARIADVLNERDKSYNFQDNSSESDDDCFTNCKLNMGPALSHLQMEQDHLMTRYHATEELTGLKVVQSEVNVMPAPADIDDEDSPKGDGTWREVTAECRAENIRFTISFYVHQPARKFAPLIYHNLKVDPIKEIHGKELENSILKSVKRPSDAVQVMRSYATANRSRRDTLTQIFENFGSHLTMNKSPNGGYMLKCQDVLELIWVLENNRSPIVPFYHSMIFEVENIDDVQLSRIKPAHKKIQDHTIDTEERTKLLSKIIEVCIEAKIANGDDDVSNHHEINEEENHRDQNGPDNEINNKKVERSKFNKAGNARDNNKENVKSSGKRQNTDAQNNVTHKKFKSNKESDNENEEKNPGKNDDKGGKNNKDKAKSSKKIFKKQKPKEENKNVNTDQNVAAKRPEKLKEDQLNQEILNDKAIKISEKLIHAKENKEKASKIKNGSKNKKSVKPEDTNTDKVKNDTTKLKNAEQDNREKHISGKNKRNLAGPKITDKKEVDNEIEKNNAVVKKTKDNVLSSKKYLHNVVKINAITQDLNNADKVSLQRKESEHNKNKKLHKKDFVSETRQNDFDTDFLSKKKDEQNLIKTNARSHDSQRTESDFLQMKESTQNENIKSKKNNMVSNKRKNDETANDFIPKKKSAHSLLNTNAITHNIQKFEKDSLHGKESTQNRNKRMIERDIVSERRKYNEDANDNDFQTMKELNQNIAKINEITHGLKKGESDSAKRNDEYKNGNKTSNIKDIVTEERKFKETINENSNSSRAKDVQNVVKTITKDKNLYRKSEKNAVARNQGPQDDNKYLNKKQYAGQKTDGKFSIINKVFGKQKVKDMEVLGKEINKKENLTNRKDAQKKDNIPKSKLIQKTKEHQLETLKNDLEKKKDIPSHEFKKPKPVLRKSIDALKNKQVQKESFANNVSRGRFSSKPNKVISKIPKSTKTPLSNFKLIKPATVVFNKEKDFHNVSKIPQRKFGVIEKFKTSLRMSPRCLKKPPVRPKM